MIQFAAYRGTSLLSRLIQFQTRSVYSHIGIFFTKDLWVKTGSGEKLIGAGSVIEAWSPGGVRINPSLGTVHTPGTPVDLFRFIQPLPRSDEQNMAEFLLAQLGKPYDWRGVLRFLTRESDRRTRRHWFCSELAFEAARVAGQELLGRTPAWRVPPDWIPRSPLLKFGETLHCN